MPHHDPYFLVSVDSSERVADLVVHGVVSPVDAVGVDAEQDSDTVAQAPGDLGRRNTSVQPQRGCCVAQVVAIAEGADAMAEIAAVLYSEKPERQ